jgi:hypothetical protein
VLASLWRPSEAPFQPHNDLQSGDRGHSVFALRHTHWKARDKLSRDRAPLVPGGHGNEPAVSAGTESSASALLFVFLSAQDLFIAGAGSSDADHSKVTLKVAH